MNIRQLHLYLGTFFAPAILFFSLTGALQTFGWHENKGGANNPAWIARLAEVHKEQHLKSPEIFLPDIPPLPMGADRRSLPREAGEARGPSPWPLKIFVGLMSIGLSVTTLIGLYMAFSYSRNRRVVWALLALGTVLPVALLYI